MKHIKKEKGTTIDYEFTSLGSVLRTDINSSGWSSPFPPGRTFPGVASRTQT
jgi:hypothetical protein